jgi:hypothetical protein
MVSIYHGSLARLRAVNAEIKIKTISTPSSFSRQASPLWKEISSTACTQACIRDLKDGDKRGTPTYASHWVKRGTTCHCGRLEVVLKNCIVYRRGLAAVCDS